MARFCRFVARDTQQIVWVNADLIRFLMPDPVHALTRIVFNEDHVLIVDGHIETAMKIIADANRT